MPRISRRSHYSIYASILIFFALPIAYGDGLEDSVVRLTTQVRYPNPIRPWSRSNAIEGYGTGVHIGGGRILTNAHLVLYATEIDVLSRGGRERTETVIQYMDPESDLAILLAKDSDLLQKLPAMTIAGNAPKTQEHVTVYGFPVGGDQLSVTQGVISRIEVASLGIGIFGKVLQVSAAINPGNSGGPGVVDGKMVGLVFSRLEEAENTGYLISSDEVSRFLQDIEDGKVDGKLGMETQLNLKSLENETVRKMLKAPPGTHGIVLNPNGEKKLRGGLLPFDIITHIGEYEIDDEGAGRLKSGLRVPAFYLAHLTVKDGQIPMKVVRDGKEILISYPAVRSRDSLIQQLRGEEFPYFVHGPLIFAPLMRDSTPLYTRLNPELLARNSPWITRGNDLKAFPDEELVVVTAPLFQHRCMKGFEEVLGQVVSRVNGITIRNFRHLVEVLRDADEPFLKVEFMESHSPVLVFDQKQIESITESILEDTGIAPGKRGSKDAMKFWSENRKTKTDG
jgi:S1-C subfamily serine protease